MVVVTVHGGDGPLCVVILVVVLLYVCKVVVIYNERRCKLDVLI